MPDENKINNINIATDGVLDFEDMIGIIPARIIYGTIYAVLFVVAIVVLALYILKLPQKTTIDVCIKPNKNIQIINIPLTTTIDSLLVSNGKIVNKGDVLIVLESNISFEAVNELKKYFFNYYEDKWLELPQLSEEQLGPLYFDYLELKNANKIKYRSSIGKDAISEKIKQLEIRIRDWESLTVIKSNISGIVYVNSRLDDNVFSPNPRKLIVMPVDSKVVAEAYFPISVSKGVKKGSNIRVSLDKFPETNFGSVKMQITSIEPGNNALDSFVVAQLSFDVPLRTDKNFVIPKDIYYKGKGELLFESTNLLQHFFKTL